VSGVRLFVAIDLPEAVRGALAAFGRAATERDPEALRAVAPDALHVTLAFLGQRPAAEVEPARAAVRAATRAAVDGSGPIALELGEVLWLAPRHPRVLTVAVADGDGLLGALQAQVSAALAAAVGFAPERRPFRAHVTVARVRHGARPRQEGLPEPPRGAFAAPAVTLYRSHLGGGPARYEALERVEL
jgi:2'-5' RNA ligase